MNYKQAKEYIDNLSTRGSVLGLENMLALDRIHPVSDGFAAIQVAGTNGKGSTTEYISRMLIEAGYKVGIYTSPVVFDYLEKIRIGNRKISQADFAKYAEQVKDISEKNNINMTIFEAETYMAFSYFTDKDIDIAVIETGLGGETDATNILQHTIMAVMTSVSLDHTQILGKTLKDIAKVKAGIIKNNCIAVTAPADDEVIAEYSKKTDKLIISDGKSADKIKLKMAGAYQRINASLAFDAVKQLQNIGYKISDTVIEKTLKETVLPGRFETISKKPLIIIDGAHNEAAAIRLRQTLIEKYPDKEKIFIMGIFADKDTDKIIDNTVDLAKAVVCLQTPDSTRAMPSIELAQAVSIRNKNVSSADSIEEAVEIARLLYNEGDIIVAFGSLSYLGRLKDIITNKKGR